jgi:hypothetical protein
MIIFYGGIFFTVFSLSNRKHWRKVIEDDKTQKTKFQKICSIIAVCFAFIALVSRVLYFNHLPVANIVFWSSGFLTKVIVIILVIKKRRK